MRSQAAAPLGSDLQSDPNGNLDRPGHVVPDAVPRTCSPPTPSPKCEAIAQQFRCRSPVPAGGLRAHAAVNSFAGADSRHSRFRTAELLQPQPVNNIYLKYHAFDGEKRLFRRTVIMGGKSCATAARPSVFAANSAIPSKRTRAQAERGGGSFCQVNIFDTFRYASGFLDAMSM